MGNLQALSFLRDSFFCLGSLRSSNNLFYQVKNAFNSLPSVNLIGWVIVSPGHERNPTRYYYLVYVVLWRNLIKHQGQVESTSF